MTDSTPLLLPTHDNILLAPPPVENKKILLHGENITRIYATGGTNAVQALDGVSFDIREGEFLAITGPSGSGKSTLLNIIGLIDRPTSGLLLARGLDLTTLSRGKHAAFQLNFVSFVFQFFNLIDTYTALENIMFPLRLQGKSFFVSRKKATEVLEFLGMSHRKNQYAKDLSGGEQQRVAIGRALAKDSEIILADEPTAHLDSLRAREVINLLRDASRTYGRTVVIVTHEHEQAEMADRQIFLRDGLIIPDVTHGAV